MIPRTTVLTLVLALLATAPAAANDVDPYLPRNLQLFAEGPDVRVVVEIASYGEPEPVTIRRTGDCGEVDVAELGWDTHEPLEFTSECLPIGQDDCEDTPSKCDDCDGDGVPECAGFCNHMGTFELVDECVPVPGTSAEYTYEAGGTRSWDDDWWSIEQTITVEHTDPCQDADPCACACRHAHGRSVQPALLTILMALLGLGALGWSRRE